MNAAKTVFTPENIRQTYTYDEYLALTDQVVAEKRTTGSRQSPEMAEYTRLNQYRMHRLDKTVKLDLDLQQLAFQLSTPQTWYVLTEAWCGDSAQNLPVIAKVAALNPNITLTMLLRDEHPEIMDAHLTRGGKAIPKLIAIDADGNELFTWGPRPAALQEIVWDYKKNPTIPYAEFQEEEQRWYNTDKTKSLQRELVNLLQMEGQIINDTERLGDSAQGG
ncbi:thioredoxin family protein [Persicitalea jodogahamensis]|uniref:Thioredoxin n=1 Tax=Persicitalea jodogahamensis TaxID=402147 RepID=A0A8J3GAU1_9BACT|nr:thioredoxin family protein [Persicitalea jodogahamensis]GHB85662.1 thioredoxin [Persicitalea jodogahamensis]